MHLLLTRPRPDIEESAARLIAMGHQPVLAPLIEIVPTYQPCPEGLWDGLLITSAQAARQLARSASLPFSRTLQVFAIGDKTAYHINEAGFTNVHNSAGNALKLAHYVQETMPRSARLLHITGLDHKDEPRDSLVQNGFNVGLWPIYQAKAVSFLPDAARLFLESGSADGIMHYSGRTTRILLDLVEQAGLSQPLQHLMHYCLSQESAEFLNEKDMLLTKIADQPHENALMQLL
jgi:uroporphyrinogen-III synthase